MAPAVGIVGEPVFFDASRSQAANPIVSYAWQFGDGTTANAVQVNKQYTAPGIYNVILTLTDSGTGREHQPAHQRLRAHADHDARAAAHTHAAATHAHAAAHADADHGADTAAARRADHADGAAGDRHVDAAGAGGSQCHAHADV
ncbi:MAG: PKD domain-containing protein [Caldilineaceae bacterium]